MPLQITLTHPPRHKGRVYVRGLRAKNSDSRCAVSTSGKRHRLPVTPGTLQITKHSDKPSLLTAPP